MKTFEITATKRNSLGKKDSAALRRNGEVPCVLYGGNEPVHFVAPELSFRNLVYSSDVFSVHLNVGDKSYKAIMQDIHFHPVTDKITHIDFLELTENKPVTFSIPVKLHGTAIGVREGGALYFKLKKVAVRALPKHLPGHIDINIEPLTIGKGIRVSDLKIDKVALLDPPNNIVVMVKTARAVVVAEPVASAAGTPAAGAPAAAAGEKAPATPEKAPAGK